MDRVKYGWFAVAMAALGVGIILIGALYLDQNHRLQRAEGEIDALKASKGAATTNVASGLQNAPAAADIVARISPAIVLIQTSGTDFIAAGSGTVIDKRGYVLTNQHVIDKGQSINVVVGEQSYAATVVASDVSLDIALLKLDSSRTDFYALSPGSSAGIRVGDEVLVFGYPLGIEFAGPLTVTRGIVSAWRTLDTQVYLQSNAALNSGNSGGCMTSLEGQMIGIPVVKVENGSSDVEAIGLSIPIDSARDFIRKALGGP